jgi:hypothetical protein
MPDHNLNVNGKVDYHDLLLMIAMMHEQDLCADFDGNLDVDENDLFLMSQNWRP